MYTRDSLACCLPRAPRRCPRVDTRHVATQYIYARIRGPFVQRWPISSDIKKRSLLLPSPKSGKTASCFLSGLSLFSSGYFMGRYANYPGRNSIVSFVPRIPNFRTFVYDSIFGEGGWEDARHDASGRG